MNKKKENKIIKMAPTIRTNKIGNRNKINKFALI